MTAAQFLEQVRAVAKGLVAAGVGEGDRVALISKTRYEWTLLDYAIWCAGAVTVPVYETSSAEQVEWILSDSGAAAVVAETAAHAAAGRGDARAACPSSGTSGSSTRAPSTSWSPSARVSPTTTWSGVVPRSPRTPSPR